MDRLFERYPQLASCEHSIADALHVLIHCFETDGKLLLCGNGGSCSDCDHIVGELMKGFLLTRALQEAQKEAMKARCATIDEKTLARLQCGLPAIALPSFSALNSAFCNDVDPDLMYAQALMALGNSKDVLLAISTSGNSKNVYHAATVAKALGIKVIALSGRSGGKLRELADVCICVPEEETYKIQELHLPIYHYRCAKIEKHFFGYMQS